MSTTYTRGVFVPAFLAAFAVVLPAQVPQTSLQGQYVLAEEGTNSTGAFASLAKLQFKDGGSVAGKELLRTSSGMQWLDLQGTYTFDGANLGTLTLTTTSQDTDGNDMITSMRYRFALSADEIRAIRTDSMQLSVAALVPADSSISGSLAFSEIDSANSASRVVSLAVDKLGNVSGTSIARKLGDLTLSALSGTYELADTGFGTLTLSSQITDADGNAENLNELYQVLNTKAHVFAVRTSGGPITLTDLTR